MGHGDRQEFAFPCPKCSVELRFRMTLDRSAGSWEYVSVTGAKWVTEGIPPEPIHVRNLDGESLVPKKLKEMSPFMATVVSLDDPVLYLRDHESRFQVALEVWPTLNHLIVHHSTQNSVLFDQTARSLGYEGSLQNWNERLKVKLLLFPHFLQYFRPFTSSEEALIRQRINYAESLVGNQLPQVIQTLVNAYPDDKLVTEIQRVRNGFMRIFPPISGIYQSLYWNKTNPSYSLEDFQLAEKRFDELKSMYIDCFETLGRISVIAATIEGVIQFGVPIVPTAKGNMPTSTFQTMANGSKPDILKQLPIANIFVSVMDCKLRNGVGHNSANYDVRKDDISYSNQNNKGTQ